MANKTSGRSEAERIATEYAREKWGREPHILGVRKDGEYYWVNIKLVWSEPKCETDWIADGYGNIVPGPVCQNEIPRCEKYKIQIGVDPWVVEGFEKVEIEEQSEPVVRMVVERDEEPDFIDVPTNNLEDLERKYGIDVDRFRL
jgi:hypothetical protein